MSRITEKPTRRYRVQFTISKEAWSRYMTVETLAAELGQVIDYRTDFERWFLKLLDAVEKELETKKTATAPTVTGNE